MSHMNFRQANIATSAMNPTPSGASFMPTDAGEVYSGLAKSNRKAARLKAAYVAKTISSVPNIKIEFTMTIWERMSLVPATKAKTRYPDIRVRKIAK